MTPASPPRHEFDDGYAFCRVIHGGWQLSPGHSDRIFGPDEAVSSWSALVEAGFTTFDVADIYTGVEEIAGKVAARFEPGRVQIHTKCVPDRSRLSSLQPRDLETMVDRSLERLAVERIDLVQFHWWDFAIDGWIEALVELDRLREAGKIRHLGVTNFDAERLTAVLEAGIPIRTHQVQYSLLDRRPAGRLADVHRRYAVCLLAYGTLAGGFLTDRWLDAPRPEPGSINRSLVKYLLIADECGGWETLQRRLVLLRKIGIKHGVDTAAVALRWVLEREGVSAVIVGAPVSGNAARNRRPFEIELDDGDRARLDSFVALHGEVYGLERDSNTHASIMRNDLQQAGELD